MSHCPKCTTGFYVNKYDGRGLVCINCSYAPQMAVIRDVRTQQLNEEQAGFVSKKDNVQRAPHRYFERQNPQIVHRSRKLMDGPRLPKGKGG